MTAPCPGAGELALLVEGGLPDGDRARIEAHLDACAACARVLAEVAWLVAPPRAAPPRYRLVRPLRDGWIASDRATGDDVFVRFTGAAPPTPLVRDPHLVDVLAAGEHAGEHFVVTPVIAGLTARAWLETAPARDRVLAMWREAVTGVAALHRAGAVHGGISLDAILIANDRALVDSVGTTSPPYRAVELLHGDPLTARSDQFALCVVLWEALAGERPFAGATIGALAVAMTAPLELPAHDRRLFRALARGLAPEPARRWPDLAALLRGAT